MQFDELSECGRCGSDAAYIQEVNDKMKLHFCYGCGFQSNSGMKKGDDFFLEQMEILPDLYKELSGEDENGLIWIPTNINVPDKGMVFADGTSSTVWKWGAVKAIKLTSKERKDKKYIKKDGTVYEYRMDMDTLKHFDEGDFMDGLSYIGVLPE